ncbi:right-handed parallel beta-helix repeat-containing protein [Prolixibacteraceae bacterium]|nr:right-handed parallel beta-helix repeat-containing protein [Prolixibacteraceae bacterium]
MRYLKSVIVVLMLLVVVVISSCKMDDELGFSRGEMIFSTDTISVDTLFADRASKVYTLKVYNPSNKNLHLHQVRLQGGYRSPFHMNLDGENGDLFKDIFILPKDSLYIFVRANFMSSKDKAPVLKEDGIQFMSDAGAAKVVLQGWNQNIQSMPSLGAPTTTLNADMPYLIKKNFNIPQGRELVIPQGVKLYFDLNTGIEVEGRLKVEGSSSLPVKMYSSNTDTSYVEIPNQWEGLIFRTTSVGNKISWCEVGNAKSGFVFEESSSAQIDHSISKNMTWAGIHAKNATLEVTNSLIANIRYYAVLLEGGGRYMFDFCTVANYKSYGFNGFRTDPSLVITDRLDPRSDLSGSAFGYIHWTNSIIDGPFMTEVEVRDSQTGKASLRFNNCLLQTNLKLLDLSDEQINGSIVSDRNTFKNFSESDYHLSEKSFARGLAKYQSMENLVDLDGQTRGFNGRFDAGCYRWIPDTKKQESNN